MNDRTAAAKVLLALRQAFGKIDAKKTTTHECPTCGHVHLPPHEDAQSTGGKL